MRLGVTLHKPIPCPHCGGSISGEEVYSANITNALADMARYAGIYMHLWRPEEIGVTRAGELIDPLRDGIDRMEADPDKYKPLGAENGWGIYEQFIQWLKRYLAACEANPQTIVSVNR